MFQRKVLFALVSLLCGRGLRVDGVVDLDEDGDGEEAADNKGPGTETL